MTTFEWHSPCLGCPDDECNMDGCERFRSAHVFAEAGQSVAETLASLKLNDIDRRRAALAIAAAIGEALSTCAARLDRDSFLAACGLTTEADHG